VNRNPQDANFYTGGQTGLPRDFIQGVKHPETHITVSSKTFGSVTGLRQI